MGLGLTEGFVGMVRAALGLRPERSAPPDIVRLGLYPVKVETCASDGSKCDVTPLAPFNEIISAEKNVEVEVGIPGASAVVQQGAIVLLGWKGGDPAQPYIMPAWATGAAVTELIFKAAMVYIADKAGAQFVALANLVKARLDTIQAAHDAHKHAETGTTTGVPDIIIGALGDVAATKTKAV